jgi:putative glycosyltransferase (TIGR04348 family)
MSSHLPSTVHKPNIVIVTPALVDANNGNWQTAQRWARMLSRAYRVRLAVAWDGGDEAAMVALHARRSAASVALWRAARPSAPLMVVLTGTDLYRDIDIDASTMASLIKADRLVVLNQRGRDALAEDLRSKARIVLQSCALRRSLIKTHRHLRALMVGHLREEKSPRTYFESARLLCRRTDILLDHIGSALDHDLGDEASTLMAQCPRYRWLGPLVHVDTRRRIQGAHVLVHPSRMEGGANVVIEAVRSGTPVLASRIDGNIGLLGEDYAGYFPVGDSAALATLVQRLRDEPAMLAQLERQCGLRAALFDPKQECASLHALMGEMLAMPRTMPPTTRDPS